MFFKKENPKMLLEGLEKAQKLLDERYEKRMITPEMYNKQCAEFGKKREIYMKKINKMEDKENKWC